MKKLLIILSLFFVASCETEPAREIYFECVQTQESAKSYNQKFLYPYWFSINFKTKTVIGRNKEWEKDEDKTENKKELSLMKCFVYFTVTIYILMILNKL